MPSVMQASFTGGELSPNLYSRIDMARWPVSLKTCRNWITQPYGGAKNRPGTYFIDEVKDSSKPARLVPFRYSATETYVLEVGDGYTRFYRNGARIYYTNAPAAWAADTNYVVGDRVEDTGSWYRCIVAHRSLATFFLDFASWELTLPGVEPLEIATPYTSADLAALRYAQSADVITLVHQQHQPANLNRYGDDTWTFVPIEMASGPWLDLNLYKTIAMTFDKTVGDAVLTSTTAIFDAASHEGRLFYIEQGTFGKPWEVGKVITKGSIRRSDGKYYEALNTATTGTLRPTHTEGTWYDGDLGVNWLYLHSGFGIAKINEVTSPTTCDCTIISTMPSELSASGSGFGAAVSLAGATYDDNGRGYTRITKAAHGITLIGPSRITLAGSGDTINFDIIELTATEIIISLEYFSSSGYNLSFVTDYLGGGGFTQIEPPASDNLLSTRWKFSAWGANRKWPGIVNYFQGRRVFGATINQPQTVWMTRTNAYNDFSVSTPIQDDDALEIPLASRQQNDIVALVDIGKLAILTSGAEWILGTGQDDVATPGNIMPRPQGARGANGIEPLAIADTVLYIQSKGQVIRDLDYDVARDKYVGSDLTAFADHLFEGRTIVDWCFQQHPFGIVWAVRDDGALLGMTYMREQQVAGWHRHDLGGDAAVESICCVSEQDEDAVYMTVKRTINGTTKRFIERLHSRKVVDAAKDSFFVDCGRSYDGTSKVNVLTAGDDFTAATITVSGGTNWDETELLTVTCSANLFSGSGDINDGIFFPTDTLIYRLIISEYVSPTVVKAYVDKTLPVGYRNVARTDWQLARDTFTIAHLKGEEVSVLSDGYSKGRYTVDATTGKITLDSPGVHVHVGLPIQADLATLSISQVGQTNVTEKNKAIYGVYAQLLESRGLKIGRDFANLFEAKERDNEGFDLPVRLQDGLVEVNISSTWGEDGSFVVRQDEPLPITITAFIPILDA